jgi:hypothetical protein
MPDERSRQAVELAEKLAEGEAGEKERVAAHNAFPRMNSDAVYYSTPPAIYAAAESLARNGERILLGTSGHAAAAVATDVGARDAELYAQKDLMSDIGGPLLFRSIALDGSWLTSTVTSLAQAIYTDRAFDRLPILADALEDAGCTSSDILDHCRGPGPHVRGCWVVDLLLAKE